jgi:polyisoprenoid-binding protein YceI
MKHLQLIRAFLILLLAVPFSNMGLAQNIDTDRSKVTFKIKNLGINTVKGSFTGMQGNLNFNAENVINSSFNVCIEASSVETGINKRDEHLRSEDFFHVSKYPEICFESNSVSKTESGFETTGLLKVHGVEKEKTIQFTKEDNTLRGTFDLNRLEFNVGQNIGTFTADEDVEVTITCVIFPPN